MLWILMGTQCKYHLTTWRRESGSRPLACIPTTRFRNVVRDNYLQPATRGCGWRRAACKGGNALGISTRPMDGKRTFQAEPTSCPPAHAVAGRRRSFRGRSRALRLLRCDSAGMNAAILAPSCASQGKRNDQGQSPVNVTWTCRRLAGVASGLGRTDRDRIPDRLIHYPFGETNGFTAALDFNCSC